MKGPIVLMVVPVHQTKGPFMLMAIVAIAPMVVLWIHLFYGFGVEDFKGAAPKISGSPFCHSNKGPDCADGCSRPSDKGSIQADGHCCNSTNGRPVDSFVFGFGVEDSKGAAPKIAGPPFRHSNKGPDCADGCSRPSDKGSIHADGHCCNSTNGRPVDSFGFGFGFGVEDSKGAAPKIAGPPFRHSNKGPNCADGCSRPSKGEAPEITAPDSNLTKSLILSTMIVLMVWRVLPNMPMQLWTTTKVGVY
jgi:hypothetical protein